MTDEECFQFRIFVRMNMSRFEEVKKKIIQRVVKRVRDEMGIKDAQEQDFTVIPEPTMSVEEYQQLQQRLVDGEKKIEELQAKLHQQQQSAADETSLCNWLPTAIVMDSVTHNRLWLESYDRYLDVSGNGAQRLHQIITNACHTIMGPKSLVDCIPLEEYEPDESDINDAYLRFQIRLQAGSDPTRISELIQLIKRELIEKLDISQPRDQDFHCIVLEKHLTITTIHTKHATEKEQMTEAELAAASTMNSSECSVRTNLVEAASTTELIDQVTKDERSIASPAIIPAVEEDKKEIQTGEPMIPQCPRSRSCWFGKQLDQPRELTPAELALDQAYATETARILAASEAGEYPGIIWMWRDQLCLRPYYPLDTPLPMELIQLPKPFRPLPPVVLSERDRAFKAKYDAIMNDYDVHVRGEYDEDADRSRKLHLIFQHACDELCGRNSLAKWQVPNDPYRFQFHLHTDSNYSRLNELIPRIMMGLKEVLDVNEPLEDEFEITSYGSDPTHINQIKQQLMIGVMQASPPVPLPFETATTPPNMTPTPQLYMCADKVASSDIDPFEKLNNQMRAIQYSPTPHTPESHGISVHDHERSWKYRYRTLFSPSVYQLSGHTLTDRMNEILDEICDEYCGPNSIYECFPTDQPHLHLAIRLRYGSDPTKCNLIKQRIMKRFKDELGIIEPQEQDFIVSVSYIPYPTKMEDGKQLYYWLTAADKKIEELQTALIQQQQSAKETEASLRAQLQAAMVVLQTEKDRVTQLQANRTESEFNSNPPSAETETPTPPPPQVSQPSQQVQSESHSHLVGHDADVSNSCLDHILGVPLSASPYAFSCLVAPWLGKLLKKARPLTPEEIAQDAAYAMETEVIQKLAGEGNYPLAEVQRDVIEVRRCFPPGTPLPQRRIRNNPDPVACPPINWSDRDLVWKRKYDRMMEFGHYDDGLHNVILDRIFREACNEICGEGSLFEWNMVGDTHLRFTMQLNHGADSTRINELLAVIKNGCRTELYVSEPLDQDFEITILDQPIFKKNISRWNERRHSASSTSVRTPFDSTHFEFSLDCDF